MSPLVVKVGGSLYDLPDLRVRFRTWVQGETKPVLLVPGGGPCADVIRHYDHVHHLGEEAAHWLALRSLSLNAHFLAQLLDWPVVEEWRLGTGALAILDPFAFALADERRENHLPHSWDVTSDTLALRVAHVCGAKELVLLKSTPLPEGMSWNEAARAGLVDGYFPLAQQRLPIKVRWAVFR